MNKKLYSFEHVSKIYKTDVEKIKTWINQNYDEESSDEFPSSLNNEFATFLCVQPLSLKPGRAKNKKKRLGKKTATEVLLKSFRHELKTIENSAYREYISEYVRELKERTINSELIREINFIFEALPTKTEYLENSCQKVYFTWQDIIFTEKGLKVDPNVLFLSIDIEGPTRILNDIKESYFQRKYSKDLYKVYVNKLSNKIEYELSSDIEKIKEIVSKHINDFKNQKFKNTITTEKPSNKSKRNFNQYKEIDIIDINRIFENNKFIQEAAKLLHNGNKAIALWENNNSNPEESLLIVLNHRIYNFVIWENINDNRACYIFKFKNENFDKKIKNLKKFISADIEYKRWDLFNNNGNKKSLNYEEYYTVIHESVHSYKDKLNSLLKPFFKIN